MLSNTQTIPVILRHAERLRGWRRTAWEKHTRAWTGLAWFTCHVVNVSDHPYKALGRCVISIQVLPDMCLLQTQQTQNYPGEEEEEASEEKGKADVKKTAFRTLLLGAVS